MLETGPAVARDLPALPNWAAGSRRGPYHAGHAPLPPGRRGHLSAAVVLRRRGRKLAVGPAGAGAGHRALAGRAARARLHHRLRRAPLPRLSLLPSGPPRGAEGDASAGPRLARPAGSGPGPPEGSLHHPPSASPPPP